MDKNHIEQSKVGDFIAPAENEILSTKTDSTPINSSSKSTEEFNTEEWMDLLDNKEILKKVISGEEIDPQNPTLMRVNRGSKVRINLETKVFSTQQVIESECFQNLEVVVGEYDVIHGVDLVLPMMYLHEKSRVLINPRFGYGSKGKLPDVEPNCRLDCTVEVLDMQDDLDSLPIDEKVALAQKRKTRGNFWFVRGEYQTAISCYRKCVEIGYEEINDSNLVEKVNRLLIDCYNNLAIVQLKIDSLNAAIESTDKALSYDAKNVKALFRKAQILEKRNDLEEAVELLKCAIELEPNNAIVGNLLTAVRKRRLVEFENENKLYQKMISSNNSQKNTDSSPQPLCTPLQSVSKNFYYYVFALSAILAFLFAYLVNRYMINYA